MVVGLITVALLFLLMASGVWIGTALGITGLLSFIIFTDFPVMEIMPIALFNWTNSFVLAAMPLFIFMGMLLLHCKINEPLYRGLSPWFSWLPGKLLHSNILACTLFAAISGSSGATCAAVGTVAFPELEKRGYDRKLVIGSIGGAGTLGLLIPPSIDLIIYAFLTRTSVGQLFLAGVFPGLMIAAMFVAYIVFVAIRRPEVAPGAEQYSWKNRFRGLLDIAPTAALIFWVLGSIYLGWATPTEAAAMGIAGAVIIGLLNRSFTWKIVRISLIEAAYLSSIFLFVMVGASFYATAVIYMGFASAVAEVMLNAPVPPFVIIGFVVLLGIALGCITGHGMMVTTLPVIFPGILALGFDPVWFGVIQIIITETGQITPPVGLNLFILMDITRETLGTIARACIPFVILLAVAIVIIYIFPDIALFLPTLMIRGG